ncbi:MAG: Ig-like domain-containing protein [Balneolaceae bacterium]|nr:Ig-like domain-containing protein [Balneolaceae bacterium]
MPNHFSIAPANSNFEGYNINNVRDKITVIVGDKFSNPVKPGTVVSFSTTGGIIQGSGQTDEDGIVSVDLISGDPRPNDAVAGSGGRPGYATVTASTGR